MELRRVMVIVRAQFEQMCQRREQEQQHFEEYLLGSSSADQQRQQEQHFDLDQLNDQHQGHTARQEFLLEQLLCKKTHSISTYYYRHGKGFFFYLRPLREG